MKKITSLMSKSKRGGHGTFLCPNIGPLVLGSVDILWTLNVLPGVN